VQLCDATLQPTYPDYMDEALYERRVPGTGELPLLDFVAALPRDLVLGLEVPLRSEADSGIGTEQRLRRCVETTRTFLAQLDR
jgi:sugar phosphate isomerase/epimerase